MLSLKYFHVAPHSMLLLDGIALHLLEGADGLSILRYPDSHHLLRAREYSQKLPGLQGKIVSHFMQIYLSLVTYHFRT